MKNERWAKDFYNAVENAHTLGMSQITATLVEYLLVCDWSPESIELLADHLKSGARLEIAKKGGDSFDES